MNLINKLVYKIRRFFRKRKVTNKGGVSIISSNCIGGMVSHDLGLQFKSPFVNLWLSPSDFVKFVMNFDDYLSKDIVFIETDKNYPVGKIGDVTIFFLHYVSKEEARRKWGERKKRINKDNLFIVCSERDGCEYSDLLSFDSLPFKNKIIFTHKYYDNIESSFCIKGYENEHELGNIFAWQNSYSGKRVYDQFDFLGWINGVK